ncbi:hypothetical protein VTO42DRAFT_1220 [Malbranchea cinnamomea]
MWPAGRLHQSFICHLPSPLQEFVSIVKRARESLLCHEETRSLLETPFSKLHSQRIRASVSWQYCSTPSQRNDIKVKRGQLVGVHETGKSIGPGRSPD